LRIKGKEEKKILKKERERERERKHGHQNRKQQQDNADIHAQNFEEEFFQSCLDAGSDQNRGCCL
jgi:hypothetical protein